MLKTIKLPTWSNVAAGATASLYCPVGLTYERVIMKFSGVTTAQIKNFQVLINGKAVQTFSDLAELAALNTYYGRADKSGHVVLHFNRPELANLLSRRTFALGTADVQNFALTCEIDAAASAPVLEAWAVQSSPQPLGSITKVKSFPRSFATAGIQDIDNIPRTGARIAAIHLFKPDVSSVEVEVNGLKAREGLKSTLEAEQELCGRTPLTGTCTHVDFIGDGDPLQALPTAGVQDLRVRPTIDTSGAVRIVVEYFDKLAGI